MAMEGVFELATPAHLLGKLEREYERWKADPVNSDCAWNFFVTAEHLPDWLARSDSQALGGKSINAFKHDRPLLRICSHIANGGKHFRAKASVHTSVDRTVIELRGWVEDGYVEAGYFTKEPMLVVHATSQEQAALGWDTPDRDALWLATKMLEFWGHFLALQSPTEPLAP